MLILASSSPRRRELLTQIGIAFTVINRIRFTYLETERRKTQTAS